MVVGLALVRLHLGLDGRLLLVIGIVPCVCLLLAVILLLLGSSLDCDAWCLFIESGLECLGGNWACLAELRLVDGLLNREVESLGS